MKLETFFEKFALIADAPDAIPRLREIILQLAVRGALTSRLPSDDSVSELLRELVEARALQLEQKGIRARPLPSIQEEEIPFQLPDGWTWTRLGNLCRAQAGFAFASSSFVEGSSGIPIIRIRDITKASTTTNYIGDYRDEFLVHNGEYLVGMDGNFTIARWRGPTALLNQRVARLQWHSPKIAQAYFATALQFRLRELQGTKAYTTVDHLSAKQIEESIVPLPPLAEQKRIVAKVDELMALCDRLEAQQQERDTQHAALVRASLARFTEAPTPANLEFLFHPSYEVSPAYLRKTILTLAVQGKLVPQDPNDEPVEELIARIAQQRRTRKAKEFPPVDSDLVPFEAPYSWAWVRLGNLAVSSDSGWSPQCGSEPRTGTNWGVLKVSAVSWGGFDPEANKALPVGMEGRPECEVRPGDFLLSRANTEELVARSVVVKQTPPRLMMSDKIVRFTFPDEIDKEFINLANLSDPSREHYMRNASGTSSSMKNVGRDVMCNLPIALPPLAEQRRIVAKVEQLMALVDALERQLAASRATAEKLLTALVAELVNAKNAHASAEV